MIGEAGGHLTITPENHVLARDGAVDGMTFAATVAKVNTLADMGLRVTLDLPEDAIAAAAWLMLAKRKGAVLRVHCVAQ